MVLPSGGGSHANTLHAANMDKHVINHHYCSWTTNQSCLPHVPQSWLGRQQALTHCTEFGSGTAILRSDNNHTHFCIFTSSSSPASNLTSNGQLSNRSRVRAAVIIGVSLVLKHMSRVLILLIEYVYSTSYAIISSSCQVNSRNIQ